jgi:glutaredoxin 3
LDRSVVVYTRSQCLFCQQVKSLLRESGVSFREVVVSDANEQAELMGKVNARSFPLVFVGGIFVGGFTHVVHLHAQHRLHELLGEDPPLAPPDDDISLPASPSESPGQSALDQIAAFARWGEYRKRQRSG